MTNCFNSTLSSNTQLQPIEEGNNEMFDIMTSTLLTRGVVVGVVFAYYQSIPYYLLIHPAQDFTDLGFIQGGISWQFSGVTNSNIVPTESLQNSAIRELDEELPKEPPLSNQLQLQGYMGYISGKTNSSMKEKHGLRYKRSKYFLLAMEYFGEIRPFVTRKQEALGMRWVREDIIEKEMQGRSEIKEYIVSEAAGALRRYRNQ